MSHETDRRREEHRDEQRSAVAPSSGKQPWQEPKLTFVEPTLTAHGKLEEVTAAFFGGFTPPPH